MRRTTASLLVLATFLALLSTVAGAHADLLLKEGDRMVFLGDSITQQQIYTRYVMDYFALRYPELNVTFRNAGVSGDTAAGAIMRFEKDIIRVKPQVVSICFGMNDAGYTAFDENRYQAYLAAMTVLLSELKDIEATAVLLTPGPVDPDKGSNWLDWPMYNEVLKKYGEGLKELAARQGVTIFDSRSLMMEVQTRAKAADPKFTMIADAIHPDEPGQALMAYGLITALGASGTASGLEIQTKTSAVVADRCQVEKLQITDNEIKFTRRDEALPTYFDPTVATIYPYAPMLEQMNRYQFKVTGLAAGGWKLIVNDRPIGDFTAEALAEGVNLANYPGPWKTLAEKVNELVAEQENIYRFERELNGVFPWITPPPPEAEVEKLAFMKKLEEAVVARERTWRELVQNRTWEWRLVQTP